MTADDELMLLSWQASRRAGLPPERRLTAYDMIKAGGRNDRIPDQQSSGAGNDNLPRAAARHQRNHYEDR